MSEQNGAGPAAIVVSPAVPKVPIQIELDGELRELHLRHDQLAERSAQPELAEIRDVVSDSPSAENTRILLGVATSLKFYLWPRQEGLTTEQVLEALCPGNMLYFMVKLKEMYQLNGLLLNQEEAEEKPENPTQTQPRTRRSSGSKRKRSSLSTSDSASPSSGTPVVVN
jgi:hypothetical protein